MVAQVTYGEQTFVTQGINIRVTITGHGKPLVLLHGLGGPLMWQTAIEPLSHTFQVIVIHLPGFGESDSPENNFSTKEYADFFSSILDALGLQKIFLAGISYGGQIALSFAQTHPERLEKLILIASTGMDKGVILMRNRFLRNIVFLLGKYLILRSMLLICLFGRFSFYDIKNRPPDLCGKFLQHISGRGKRDVWLHAVENIFTEQYEIEKILPDIRCPVLIIWGEQDLTIPVQSAYLFHKNILNSKVIIFSECAHSLPLEKPAELNEAIISFTQPS
jgi:pimeloyl-ACP methyl ester carboxylesterase